jgi:hypothetical protein
MMDRIEIRDLTMEYDSAGYVVRPIHGLDLEVSSGELVLLEDSTRQHSVDGGEATHDRSVAGSRPASPTELVKPTRRGR